MTLAGDLVTVDQTGTADFATVQEAIQAVAAGSTVEIRPGTYLGKVVVDKNVRLVGAGAGTVLQVQGPSQSWPDDSADDSSAVLEIRGASGVVIENMSFSGPEDGVKILDSSDITVRNVDASGNGDDGIDVRGSAGVTISGTFSGNGDTGVLVREGSTGAVVESSRMTQNTENGLRLRDSSDCVVRASDASGNGDDGVLIRDSSSARVTDSTANDNLGYGIRIRNSPATILEDIQTANNRDGSISEE
jgi:parallel beta-helix repeat protein